MIKNTYISMLRGINVGGRRMVKMDDLRSLYESLGFTNVTTCLQSGNVVFDSTIADTVTIASTITMKIAATLHFNVSVLVRTTEGMKKLVEGNPFLKVKSINTTKLHVTFFSDTPDQALVHQLDPAEDPHDQFKIVGTEAYLYCPLGYGRTRFSNTFFEKRLKVEATTRNWNTVLLLTNHTP